MTYSVTIKRADTGELAVEIVRGEVRRDSFTRVKSGLTLEQAQAMSERLLRDFAEKGRIYQMYEHGERAIPPLAVQPTAVKITRKSLPNGDMVLENTSYKQIADIRHIKTNHDTAQKIADKLATDGVKFSSVLRQDKTATVAIGETDYNSALNYAQLIDPKLAPPRKLTFNEILSHFANVTSKPNGQHMANCPSCRGDSKQHLYIKHDEHTGRVMLDCKHGCQYWEVAQAANLQESDLFTEHNRNYNRGTYTPRQKSAPIPKEKTPESPIIGWKNYNYTDMNGAKLYQKGVAYRENGDKFAAWKRYGENGEFLKGLDGAKPPLFQQHNLRHDKVYIVEGEKDVQTMQKLGLPAVCSPHGSNWSDGYAPQFAGKEVVVITDNDTPGKNYGRDIENSLEGVAKGVTVIPAETLMQGLKQGGDITDVLETLKSPNAVRDLISRAENPEPCVNFDEIDIIETEINENEHEPTPAHNEHEYDEKKTEETEL
jgi:5S rRNA maturation endonuclease (ribonuclease M5)